MFDLGPLFADILVASTAPEFIRRVRLVLQAAGYTVRQAESSDDTLAIVQDNPPDLILLDVILPAADGRQLVRQLKADPRLPFVPIIMVSSEEHPEHLASAIDAGADEFMYQSASNAELLTRVRAMLRLKSTTDRLAELNSTLEQKVQERTRELEEAHTNLRHAEKLSSLGRLAATIVHEINNPLTGIVSLVELVKDDIPVDSPLQRDLKLIQTQVNIIAKLLQQLRDFSKPPCKERTLVTVNDILEDLLALVGKNLAKKQIQVIRQFDPDLPPVLASAEQMSEIFLNLILNAQDAMPNGGTLTLSTCPSTKDRCIEIKVTDNGVGMEPQVLERMFEPFFTTKGQQGTGLGLAISHRIVHDHGGEIYVESQPGQGTTFLIQLPLLEQDRSEEQSCSLTGSWERST